MQTYDANIAHNLYLLYETLSVDIQRQFLQELFQKQSDKLELFEFKELKQKSAKETWQDFFENPQFPTDDFMNERVDLPLQERELF
jgi:hypothetical protein